MYVVCMHNAVMNTLTSVVMHTEIIRMNYKLFQLKVSLECKLGQSLTIVDFKLTNVDRWNYVDQHRLIKSKCD